jgi:hypothetical protein
MKATENFASQRIALWCNLVFVALTAVGWLGIGGYINMAEANLGLEATKEFTTDDHKWQIIIGCTIFYIAAGLLTPGSIAFGVMLSKVEGRHPIWSFTTAVCGVFISLIIFFNCCAWILTAYRPELGADVIQAWNDWAWFAFLLGWIYLTIEMVGSGLVELMDDRPEPMIPRWLTWYTFAGAVTIFCAAGPAFTKSGPFAYHGLLAFYVPVAIWGSYIALTTWFMLKELVRQQAAQSSVVTPADSGAKAMV